MTATRPVLKAVIERDIDLLLAEELLAAHSFQELLLSFADVPEAFKDPEQLAFIIEHSYGHVDSTPVDRLRATGGLTTTSEIDLRVQVQQVTTGTRGLFLIENKLAEDYQPNQPERYAELVLQARASGEYAFAAAVLVAPAEYKARDPRTGLFDFKIPLEEVGAYYERRAKAAPDPEAARRFAAKRDIISQALRRARRETDTVASPAVTGWRRKYYNLASALNVPMVIRATGLDAATGRDHDFEFRDVLVRPHGLRPVKLVHRTKHCRVTLEYQSLGRTEELFESSAAVVRPLAGPQMTVARRNKSLGLSLHTPYTDPSRGFDAEAVRAAVAAAVVLRDWHEANVHHLVAHSSHLDSGANGSIVTG